MKPWHDFSLVDKEIHQFLILLLATFILFIIGCTVNSPNFLMSQLTSSVTACSVYYRFQLYRPSMLWTWEAICHEHNWQQWSWGDPLGEATEVLRMVLFLLSARIGSAVTSWTSSGICETRVSNLKETHSRLLCVCICSCTFIFPNFTIENEAHEPVLTIKGPLCTCRCCSDVEFQVRHHIHVVGHNGYSP